MTNQAGKSRMGPSTNRGALSTCCWAAVGIRHLLRKLLHETIHVWRIYIFSTRLEASKLQMFTEQSQEFSLDICIQSQPVKQDTQCMWPTLQLSLYLVIILGTMHGIILSNILTTIADHTCSMYWLQSMHVPLHITSCSGHVALYDDGSVRQRALCPGFV